MQKLLKKSAECNFALQCAAVERINAEKVHEDFAGYAFGCKEGGFPKDLEEKELGKTEAQVRVLLAEKKMLKF